MEFLYPGFLWALTALAIPIIIHLFFFRRFKKVDFTNVRFLKEIKEETSSRNKLKNFLVLLSRLLALALLVFAFTQPFLPEKENVDYGDKAVSLFIDNSYSMQALSSDVPLIDKAKHRAREIVEAYQETDDFQILTHNFKGRHQRLVNKENALKLINEIEITAHVKELKQVVQRQQQTLEKSSKIPVSYIVSDFQNSIMNLDEYVDTSLAINLLPLQDVQDKNISIDSVWIESPVALLNQNNVLKVKLTNHGSSKAESIRISLILNGTEKPVGTVSLDSKKSIEQSVNFNVIKPGWQSALVKITDYPVQFDDEYFCSFYVDESVDVLTVNSSTDSPYLRAAFKGLSYFNLENSSVSRLDYSRFQEYDLILLNDLNSLSSGLQSELEKYVLEGGKVLIFPGPNADVNNYNQFLSKMVIDVITNKREESAKVASINTSEFVFSDVYEKVDRNLTLPVASRYYSLSNYQSRGRQDLMTLRNGGPYLSKYIKGDGLVYICVAPLHKDFNDLVSSAEVFVPMLYKMSLSTSSKIKIANTIGQDRFIKTRSYLLTEGGGYLVSGPSEFIPSQTQQGNHVILDVHDQVATAGFYDITFEGKLINKSAFNNDRKESDLSYALLKDLMNLENSSIHTMDLVATGDLSKVIGQRERGVVLWKYCLIFALIFLAIEVLLLRFWKT